ncbi:MAG TPA: NAD(P)/FAD-dependent oxidoreductase [Planctomycetota bacterium]|nr:NAD(P)/FAD-dependent oxidoreductase [Planctomycetota bacterium]
MARTPLLSAIRRLYREHRAARDRGIPVDALRERGLSRRTFLAGTAAAVAASAVPALAQTPRNGPKIVIVGAGIAGLTCALTLRDNGIASTVYEASGRIGGRMFSNTGSWAQGQVSEWCGELIDTGHKTVRGLAKRFGLKLDNLLKAQPAGSEDTYFLSQLYYPKARADQDFAPVFDAVSADEASAPFPTTFDSFTPAGEALSAMTIRKWVDTRVPGGHASPLGKLLELAYAIEYGADVRDQSALNLVYLLAFQPKPNELAVFGESDETFHIRGGNEQLPRVIADSLGAGVVRTGRRLEKLRLTAGGRYQLSFAAGQASDDVTADFVVLALPFSVLKHIDTDQAGFDDLKKKAIQELGEGRNGKTQLQFTSRLWNQTGPWPGISNGSSYSDTGYQAGWDVTRAQPGASGILVFYSGGSVTTSMRTTTAFSTQTNPDAVADAVDALHRAEPVFPGLSSAWNGRTTQSLPHLSPFMKASYAFYRPGQYTAFAGYEKARQGGVYFCGEHTSIDFQGFMEGGASEGERAGKQIAKKILD